MSLRVIEEWWTPSALAKLQLTDLPSTKQGINERADTENWRESGKQFPANPNGVWRQSKKSGGGFEYRIDRLPIRAQAELIYKLRCAMPEPRPDSQSRYLETWASFDALPEGKKAKARAKLDALLTVSDLTIAGMEHDLAMKRVAQEANVSLRTLYNWQAEVWDKRRADWLPHLTPRHFGSVNRSDCDEAAWDWYRVQYLRQEQPSHAESYRLLKEAAKQQGWTVPSKKTLERRIAELPETTLVLSRKGPKALERMYPAQERDRSALHALQAVNSDTHTWDVFVEWEDGKTGRVSMCAWQDLYSGKFLSRRFCDAPNKDAVRLSLLDVIETYGIMDDVVFDNGRENASKWITGGAPNRYRFKVKDEEPLGMMPALGVTVHWAQPYRGQSKPIERGFRDFAMNIAKHPAFAGAWTGNTIANKPENYGSKAVPIATFMAIVDQRIAEHNARLDRKAKVCGGKRSFDQVFQESYETSPIRQASVAQKRMLLLAPEMVTARKPDGAVYVCDNRYWAPFLSDQIGRKVVLRLDPQNLHAGVHVERADGVYLGFAECKEAVGFFDTDKARDHARAKSDWLKAEKAKAAAEKRMTMDDLVALLPAVEAAEAPTARVVRPLFGSNGNAALKVDADAEEERPALAPGIVDFVARLQAPRKKNGADG